MNKGLYIAYNTFEMDTLNLDYYVLTDWDTVRFNNNKSQFIVRIRPGYEEFFNLSRALTHSEAIYLTSSSTWKPPK
jgi:hypothetical protein